MNRLLLLLAFISISFGATAQPAINRAPLRNYFKLRNAMAPTGSRWYNYGEAMDTTRNYQKFTVEADITAYDKHTGLAAVTIWNDTSCRVLESGKYRRLTKLCEGLVLDPTASIFNTDPDNAYAGLPYITDTNAYWVDSVEIFGIYQYNSLKTTEVDTLRLVFITGGNIFTDTPGSKVGQMIAYDAVHNVGTGGDPAHLYPLTAPHYLDILLDNTNRNDTLPGGVWHRTIAVNGALGAFDSAGHPFAMTITYVSGDPTITFADTVVDTVVDTWKGWGKSKFNVWQPIVSHYMDGMGNLQWAPYQCWPYHLDPVDNNLGHWKNARPSTDKWFTPTWGWSEGAGPSVLQYPYVSIHGLCPTCGLVPSPTLQTVALPSVNIIHATPNPADDNLNISFSLAAVADVSIVLTDMLGHVVGEQRMSGITKGNAVFNTSNLHSGMYMYTVVANGQRTNGRVVVTH